MALPASLAPAPAQAPARARQARVVGMARLARMGSGAFGETELLALASGCRLPVAAGVLESLGGPAALAGASVGELVRAGLAPGRAAALVAAVELVRRADGALAPGRWVIRSPADLAERVLAEMGRLEREELRVAILNTRHAVEALVTVYVGSLAGCPVRVGEVFCDAVRRHGAAIVVIHNHPSGDPTPSPEDLRITRELAEAGRLLDVELLDHLVIGRERWVSLRGLGSLG